MHWIGLMSGTSLDGLDIVYTTFHSSEANDGQHDFSIIATDTVPFDDSLKVQLQQAKTLSASELTQLDLAFGTWMGKQVKQFMLQHQLDPKKIEGVASHGQTVFHRPDLGYTLQIGCGQALQKACGLTVVNDFRTGDVLAGGQGAPLVPIGEKHLFNDDCDAFINLGGFANIGFYKGDEHLAFDISPCNLPLNQLVEPLGLAYDKNGQLARSGKVDEALLNQLNALPYYHQVGPKSLGTEWLDATFLPHLPKPKAAAEIANVLSTVVEHIALQTSQTLNHNELKKVMITGGGAYNEYLLERIRAHTTVEILLPSTELIEYKEALIFAYMGYRRLRGLSTTLASITGAESDQITGVVHGNIV